MGTWDATVLGNDTSAEVHEAFFHYYDRGASIEEIEALIAERFAESLALPEDTHNVLLARALARWETGTLDDALLGEVRAAIERGAALAAWLGDPATERARAGVLTKLLAKLSIPRASIRRRKKPPVPLVTRFPPGTCASFRRSSGEHGGVVVIESAFFARQGRLALAATSLAQVSRPTLDDFLRARLVGFAWEDVLGAAVRFASSNGKAGRVGVRSYGYDSAAARAPFVERVGSFFEVAGALPIFTQILLTTGGGSLERDDEALARDLETLDSGQASREPLGELAVMLTKRR